MAQDVTKADEYINANCIDIEDWTDCDVAKKQRILNVAERTLSHKYSQYTIPAAAVYEFANELAIAFNDTNRLQQQGVAAFGLTGVANFTFKDWAKTGVDAWIPESALDIIGEANGGINIGRKTMKWVTM